LARRYGNNFVSYCMPNSKWLPPIDKSLGCERKCVGKRIGDGYCDCENNREYCSFDGGDCCKTSVLFMGERCACKKPKNN